MTVASLSDRHTWYEAYVRTFPKGRVLSHFLGIIIASQFVVSGAANYSIPYPKLPLNTAWLDLPLRLLLVWLLLDRNWRVGRLKFTPWEVLALGFPVIVGIFYPFAMADASIGADVDGYKAFLGDMLRFYTVFILVREANVRAGFDSRVMLTWIMGGLAFSAALAILQAFNVGGVRQWSQTFFDQIKTVDLNEGYRARGTAQHWNGFANTMVIGLLIAASALHYRRLKWWEYAFGVLFILGLGASTSRGGYATLFVTVIAAGIFFLVSRRPKTGLAIIGSTVLAILAFVAVVVSAKIDRFNDLIVPPKVQSRDVGSLAFRMDQGRRLMRVGMEHPIIGTGPSEKLYFNQVTDFYSVASVPGALDVTYPLLFAQFGIVGIAYMVGLVWFFVRYIWGRHKYHPFAFLAFTTGVALAVHSFSEMLLLSEVMVLVSAVAGLALSRFAQVALPAPARRFDARVPDPPLPLVGGPEPARAYMS